MKTLNELTPKERTELYKKALVDWTERPNDFDAHTEFGLCAYFKYSHDIYTYYEVNCNMCTEWVTNVRERLNTNRELGSNGDPIPRIAALNAIIKELEEEL